ncbi:unnamed protein product (macronuclear) [Paramecium tetraurelia]|uniref:Uncharacterized protein n=1 Tax=Paramecium tetraurelia TaxID=5888 RepID=A0CK85_PARTE|nr:uncharacterized protein GSPATT00000915001 [Paramecium tetraurelia]CAK71202.1 unnamed protein product [Paramecium tetraurelia]|eukprot:XP_001438599.1 hypothetical protein (macronuclear) [Paramecium tetraurelia strain d4-2]
MILSKQNYDGKRIDTNRKLREEEKNKNQFNSNFYQNKEKRSYSYKNKKKMKNRQLICKKQREEKSLQIQNREATKQNLRNQNYLILNHQNYQLMKKTRNIKDRERYYQQCNKLIIYGRADQKREREMYKLIVEQQMKAWQQIKEKRKKTKEFQQLIYKEQTQNGSQKNLKQEDSYRNVPQFYNIKQFYQRLSERQNALQDIYRQKVDNPKLQLDYIFDQQLKERQNKKIMNTQQKDSFSKSRRK